MKFAFIIDPIAQLDPTHDTSVALMEAAQEQGHDVWITQVEWLSVIESEAWATLEKVKLEPVKLVAGHWQAEEKWYYLSPPSQQPLAKMDAVFMRKDPPFNVPYLYASQILDLLNQETTLVVNSPRGLQTANEKLYALNFRQFIPETIVSQEKQTIRKFVEAKGTGVFKPLGGYGGKGILVVKAGDRNLNSLVEISTKSGQEPIIVQAYLPEASAGDKRIILLDGKPIGAVNRIPSSSEFRGNMAVGGTVAATEITPREQEICAAVGPKLKADGLYFVGLDVIGGYLTEVNVTSPTGIREIDRLDNTNLGQKVMKWVEETMGKV